MLGPILWWYGIWPSFSRKNRESDLVRVLIEINGRGLFLPQTHWSDQELIKECVKKMDIL